jgi:tRNA (guanine9-N1)-methyltransferase
MAEEVSSLAVEEREEREEEEQEQEEEGKEESHGGEGEKKLSKNQLRKLRKTQKWEAAKLFKKEQKKLMKMNKRKREGDEEAEEGEDGGEGNVDTDHSSENHERKLLKQQKRDNFIQECNLNFKVVIDCSWEDDHNESTLKSLTQQIMYCYGSNRRYDHPSRIFITGVGPKTSSLLQKNNSQHWVGASIHSEDFLEVLSTHVPLSQQKPPSECEQQQSTQQEQQQYPHDKIVYLTSDSENVLEELDSSTAYVIGGIVDRNRLKGITNKKAEMLNLRTAKLPIKEYMKMAATHVLTVNHVFDILKQFQENNSWKIALEKVLPMRKGAQLAISSSNTEKDHEEKREEVNEEEEETPPTRSPKEKNAS